MTEKQVCKNNWMRRIAGMKRIAKRRMEELREEVGESLTKIRIRGKNGGIDEEIGSA